MMTSIDLGAVRGPNAIDKMVKDVLKEYFGGKDILDDKVIDPAFLRKNDFSVVQLVETIKAIVTADIDKKVAELKKKAMNGGKPGDDLEPLPNVKQLKAIFREVAKSAVKAVAGTKKSVYAAQIKAIGAKIVKDDKSVVIGKFNDESAVKA